MAALTTAAIVGSAVIGAGATVANVVQKRKEAAETKARLKADAAAASDRASLSSTREDTGADIVLGRDGVTTEEVGTSTSPTATSRRGSVRNRVGGLRGPGASSGVGL